MREYDDITTAQLVGAMREHGPRAAFAFPPQYAQPLSAPTTQRVDAFDVAIERLKALDAECRAHRRFLAAMRATIAMDHEYFRERKHTDSRPLQKLEDMIVEHVRGVSHV